MLQVQFLLSGLKSFKPVDWQPRFDTYVKFLMKKRETTAVQRLLAWFDYRLFSLVGDRVPETASIREDSDSDDEDWSALDKDFDFDDDDVPQLRPVHQRSIPAASGILRRARTEALSRALTAALPTGTTHHDGSATSSTPPTRACTPALSPTVTPPEPEQAGRRPTLGNIAESESISVALSYGRPTSSWSVCRQDPAPAALATPVVPLHSPPAPTPAAPVARVLTMGPPLAPAQVAAVPDVQARKTRRHAIIVNEPSAGPSGSAHPVPAVPVPDAPIPKPKPQPRPRGRGIPAKGASKGKTAVHDEDAENVEESTADVARVRALRRRNQAAN